MCRAISLLFEKYTMTGRKEIEENNEKGKTKDSARYCL
jgi:hypothetical protein